MSADPAPRFLFLQGNATPFFGMLGAALARQGFIVRRINFTGGDRLFWRRPGAIDYRGDLEGWPDFLETRLDQWHITDIVLFGDCRPLHRAAIIVATRRGITVHVAEEGYLRPNWITLELGGVNGFSSLPRDPDWYRRAAARLPPWRDGMPIENRFQWRAVWDVAYHLATLAFAWRYPFYRTHLYWHPFREYAGWIRRFARSPVTRRRAAKARVRLAARAQYFLLPLQLDSDSQIRFHSDFGDMAAALDHVIQSFARFADAHAHLVVKQHPLDPELTDWRHMTARLATTHGIADRVLFLSRGAIDPVLARCRGVVTVNSTTGILALARGIPVIVSGRAIYDLPGLTDQHGLDRFWRAATPPDTDLFDAFRRVVAHRTQVNGGFFSRRGLTLAVKNAVARLTDLGPEPSRQFVEERHLALDDAPARFVEREPVGAIDFRE